MIDYFFNFTSKTFTEVFGRGPYDLQEVGEGNTRQGFPPRTVPDDDLINTFTPLLNEPPHNRGKNEIYPVGLNPAPLLLETNLNLNSFCSNSKGQSNILSMIPIEGGLQSSTIAISQTSLDRNSEYFLEYSNKNVDGGHHKFGEDNLNRLKIKVSDLDGNDKYIYDKQNVYETEIKYTNSLEIY